MRPVRVEVGLPPEHPRFIKRGCSGPTDRVVVVSSASVLWRSEPEVVSDAVGSARIGVSVGSGVSAGTDVSVGGAVAVGAYVASAGALPYASAQTASWTQWPGPPGTPGLSAQQTSPASHALSTPALQR